MKFPPPFSSSSCPLESLPPVSALGLPTPDFSPPHPSQLRLYPRCLLSPLFIFARGRGSKRMTVRSGERPSGPSCLYPFLPLPPFLIYFVSPA